MRLSISRSTENIWAWLLWSLGLYLVLEMGPFLITGWVLKKTAGGLARSYLAFALPAAIIMPLIWWLRKWEEKCTSPKRVARGWGLSVALFDIAMMVALFYSGVVLGLIDPRNAVGGFIVAVLGSVSIVYFSMYRMALARISSRWTGKAECS
jgi:chromate transport protein ChrA